MKDVSNIKSKALSSAIWKFLERIIAQVISLFVSIIIARILTPSDYGAVSVVTIFFAFANVIISGGLNSALIQKKDADKEDYSTVLLVSVFVSILIYVILFFAAPYIANLYDLKILTSIIRVMALSLPIYAVKSVVCAYISVSLQFKKFFFATIGGTIVSAIVGISMALAGFGAWALIAQQITNTFIDTVILLLTTKMPILFYVSFVRFKALFKYGWKVFVSSVLSVIYSEIIPLVIGVKFSAANLSFYTKGKSFPNLLSSTTTNTLSAVLFPVMSKFQDDKECLLRYTRRYIRIASYISFPIMLGFFAVSDNFIRVLLTEKWLPASFYIKVFCISVMFDMIHIGNCETIKAMGRSDIFLIMEIIKKSSYFIIIALFLFLGNSPQVLAVSTIFCTFVAIIVNSVPNRKLIGYSFKSQMVDLIPNLITAIIMCICVVAVGTIQINMYLSLTLQILVGVVVYILLSFISKNESFYYLLDTIKSFKHKN